MGEMTLREALDEYREVYLRARNFADRTREEYANDLKDLVKFLEKSGIKRVGDLGLIDLERYLAELDRRGYSGSTRKRKSVTIRSLFSFLYMSGFTNHDVAKKLIPPRADNNQPRVLTQKEYNRLREACNDNVRDKAIIELLLQTGIRLSEITRLTLDDIVLPDVNSGELNEMGSINIRSHKNLIDRTLALNKKICEALEDYLRFHPYSDTNSLFLNRFNKPLGARGVQKIVKKYLRKADISGASVHSLRHTFGTHHLAKGTSLKTIQRALGHKDQRSTSVYVTLAEEITRKEMYENVL